MGLLLSVLLEADPGMQSYKEPPGWAQMVSGAGFPFYSLSFSACVPREERSQQWCGKSVSSVCELGDLDEDLDFL